MSLHFWNMCTIGRLFTFEPWKSPRRMIFV
ncbi:hypothetical protein CsSME_00042318 [Camellia sinensis var. sinensis]